MRIVFAYAPRWVLDVAVDLDEGSGGEKEMWRYKGVGMEMMTFFAWKILGVGGEEYEGEVEGETVTIFEHDESCVIAVTGEESWIVVGCRRAARLVAREPIPVSLLVFTLIL